MLATDAISPCAALEATQQACVSLNTYMRDNHTLTFTHPSLGMPHEKNR